MLSINLEALGVSEKALQDAILRELGMSKQEAVAALAEKLGVSVNSSPTISDGARVTTTKGEAQARLLTPSELATLKSAAEITNRLFS